MNRTPRGLAILVGLGLLLGACGMKGPPRPPEQPPPAPGPFEPAGPGLSQDAGT